MLGFVHILEICFHPTNVWHESWDRIENFGFYTHPINMFDDLLSVYSLYSLYSWVFHYH